MELKSASYADVSSGALRFNRTFMELKYRTAVHNAIAQKRFNRTFMKLKSSFTP